jgi:FG-GAP repeat
MKKILFLFAAFFCSYAANSQSVGIGTTLPHASAVLELQSNNKGLLISRVTTSQRKNISGPATGLLVFDTDKNCIYMFDGQEWLPLSAGEKGDHTTTRTPAYQATDAGFGHAVCISGNYAVVSSHKQTGVGIDTAFVFFKTAAGWTIQAKLVQSNGVAGDDFGAAVAITNDQVLVGAPERWGGGAVYVYSRVGEVWTQTAIITIPPTTSTATARFGSTISVDGLHALIGAPYYLTNSLNVGAVYCFYRNAVGWQLLQQLLGPTDRTTFGHSIDISGTYALIGIPNLFGTSDGRVHVYTRSGLFWNIFDTLYEHHPNVGRYGRSVAISSGAGWAFVGSGSAIECYKITGGQFNYDAFITDPSLSDPALSIYDDLLVAGATETGTGMEARGSVIIFRYDPTNLYPATKWVPWKAFRDNDNLFSYHPFDRIGNSVFIHGDNLIFGNPGFNHRKGKVMFVNLE